MIKKILRTIFDIMFGIMGIIVFIPIVTLGSLMDWLYDDSNEERYV